MHVAAVPAMDDGCSTDGATSVPPLVIPGGSEPDWGPADVPADRPKPDVAPQPAGPAQPGATLAARVKRAKLSAALRRGLALTVSVPGDGRLSATATAAGRKVAAARARTVGAGQRQVRLAFTRRARRALARRSRVRLAVKVRFRPGGGAVQTTALGVTLKR